MVTARRMRLVHRLCWLGRLRRETDGAAVVEFALVAPLFLMLVFAMIDVARAFYTVNQLATAVREGGRYAAVLPEPSKRVSDIGTLMRSAAPSLGATGMTDARIEVVTDQQNQRVTVRVRNYPLRLITPFANTVSRSEFTLTREATFRWEMAPGS